MAALPVDHFEDLDTLLTFAPNDPSLWSSLLFSLEQAKSQLQKLLDFPKPDAAEKSALEGGAFPPSCYYYKTNMLTFPWICKGSFKPPDSVVIQVSKQFTEEALAVSSQLSISESLAASLLVQAHNRRHLWGLSRANTEIAVLLFHQLRANLLNVLIRLFKLLHQPHTPHALRSLLLTFASDLTAPANASTPWAEELLKQIDKLKPMRDQAQQAGGTQQPGLGGPQAAQGTLTASTLFAPQQTQQQQQQQPTQSGGLSKEVQAERAIALQKERCLLGSVLYHAAAAGFTPAPVITAVIKWLQNVQSLDDAPVFHVTAAALAALDPTKQDFSQDALDPMLLPSLHDLFDDAAFVKSLHTSVVSSNAWKIQHLRNTILLQWTLFYSHACQNKPSLESETQIWEETVEGEVHAATKGGALTFLLNELLSFRALEDALVTVGQRYSTAAVDASFQDDVLHQVESLVVTFISTMHTVLKKIKNREEDARAFSTSNSRISRRLMQSQADPGPPPRDIEALFALIEAVYRGRPDAALSFWATEDEEPESHRLHAFLRWAADSRGQMATAFFVMLSALSTGEKAASYAFEFLAMNSSNHPDSQSLCSWSMLFGAIAHYAGLLQSAAQTHAQQSEMPPEEVDALRAFARLLAVVVNDSTVARAALFDNQHYQPVASLLSLIVHPISLDLKGDLLRAVAAFCRPGGSAGAEAARKTWMLLEQSQILPTLSQSASGRIEGGIVTELEAVEVPAEVYPATSAFIELLVNLVQKPADDPSGPLVSIPEHLGAPARRPGIDPYLGFAVDTVLLPLFSRRFNSQKQKWALVDSCLRFLENCLSTLEVDLFSFSANPASLAALVARPGFEVMLRLMASTPLFPALLGVVSPTLDELESEQTVPQFRQAVLSALRVVEKLIALEGGFVDLILPSLLEQAPQHVIAEKYAMLRSVQPLSDVLLQQQGVQDIIPRLAALVNYTALPAIALQSIKIVTALSRSRGFATLDAHIVPSLQPASINRLVGFIDAYTDGESVARGYTRLLEPNVFDEDKRALYDAILDLLLVNTAVDKTAPNIAHYLLGYTYRDEPGQPVEIDPDSSRFGLGAIVDLLLAIDKAILPAKLAERCFNLIANLCTHEYTARCTHRFLRTQYDFFSVMLEFLPFAFPEPSAEDDSAGAFLLDNDVHQTTAEVASAILQAEAWFLKSVALDMNELASDGQRQRLEDLAASLYKTAALDLTTFTQDSSKPQQGLPCLQEILASLTFEWQDDREPPEVQLALFGTVPFASALMSDANGAQVYDLAAVVRLLQIRKRELQNGSMLNTAEQQHAAAMEMRAIIQYLAIQNAQRLIEGARHSLLQAWTLVVDMLVVKALEAVPTSDRQTVLFDLLDATIHALESPRLQGDNADLLSSTANILVSTLREEQLQSTSVLSTLDSATSGERLVRALKLTSDAILSLGLSPAARGELYAVLTHFLRLVLHIAAQETSAGPSKRKVNTVHASATALSSQLQRLVSQVSRDAIASDEIWQMAALTLLDTLSAVMHSAGHDGRMLDSLSKENSIQNVLVSLKSTEADLVDCLSIDPCESRPSSTHAPWMLTDNVASLNALYIFEAKLAFLTRLALTPAGCQKLTEAQLIPRLGQCDWLTMAPAEDNSMGECLQHTSDWTPI